MQISDMKTTNPILEIRSGKLKGQQLIISAEEVVIGRGEGARVRVLSPEVSRAHCRLTYSSEDRRLFVEDLQSRNGTFLNGRPLREKSQLKPGSSITVGPITFVMLGDAAAVSQSVSHPDIRITGKGISNQQLSDDEIISWLSETADPISAENDDDFSLLPPIFRSYPLPGAEKEPVSLPTRGENDLMHTVNG